MFAPQPWLRRFLIVSVLSFHGECTDVRSPRYVRFITKKKKRKQNLRVWRPTVRVRFPQLNVIISMLIVAYGLLLHAINIRRAIGAKLRHNRPVGARKLTLGEEKMGREKPKQKLWPRKRDV